MPGYVIHLAVAEKNAKLSNVVNKEEFMRGVIAPDLLKSVGIDAHYGNSSNPNLKMFLQKHDLKKDYNKGYFLHLVTDYLFYNKLLGKWAPQIYDDYNVLNPILINKYNIQLPNELQNCVKFEDKALTILKFDDIISFIETVGKMPINQMCKKYVGEINYECQK